MQTVMAGGDTDTNAAIAGALLGAVHGRDAIPAPVTPQHSVLPPAAGVRHIACAAGRVLAGGCPAAGGEIIGVGILR